MKFNPIFEVLHTPKYRLTLDEDALQILAQIIGNSSPDSLAELVHYKYNSRQCGELFSDPLWALLKGYYKEQVAE